MILRRFDERARRSHMEVSLGRCEEERYLLPKALKRRVLTALVIILLFVVVLEVWATNALVTYGDKVTKMESSIRQLKVENQVLENRVAQKASLNKLKNHAVQLGFEKIKGIDYIQVPQQSINLSSVNAF